LLLPLLLLLLQRLCQQVAEEPRHLPGVLRDQSVCLQQFHVYACQEV
jgi:hypothetical protein